MKCYTLEFLLKFNQNIEKLHSSKLKQFLFQESLLGLGCNNTLSSSEEKKREQNTSRHILALLVCLTYSFMIRLILKQFVSQLSMLFSGLFLGKGLYVVWLNVVYLLSSQSDKVFGTGTPADFNARITLVSQKQTAHYSCWETSISGC